MMEHKRCPIAFEESNITTLTPKRHKADLSLTTKVSSHSLYRSLNFVYFACLFLYAYGPLVCVHVELECFAFIHFTDVPLLWTCHSFSSNMLYGAVSLALSSIDHIWKLCVVLFILFCMKLCIVFFRSNGFLLSWQQEKKEKVGERIAALQQLVSPYGKVCNLKKRKLHIRTFYSTRKASFFC